MTLHRGKIPAQYKISEVRSLAREDLAILKDKRTEPVAQRLREPHHRLARIIAAGVRLAEAAEICGFSIGRVRQYNIDPTFRNLVAEYAKDVDSAYVDAQREIYESHNRVRLKALRHVEEHFDKADEEGELIPLNRALAVFGDTSDRVGIQKKSTQVNVNIDFAAKLEQAISRSGKIIESPASAASSNPAREIASPTPLRRRSFA